MAEDPRAGRAAQSLQCLQRAHCSDNPLTGYQDGRLMSPIALLSKDSYMPPVLL